MTPLPSRRALAACALLLSALLRCGPGATSAARAITIDITDVSPGPDAKGAGTSLLSTSGRAVAVGVSPDGERVYVGTAHAGLFRSDDRGVTFRQVVKPQRADLPACVGDGCVFPGSTIRDIAVWPLDPDVLFVGTDMGYPGADNGIYRSADGGATWSLVHRFACGFAPPPEGLPVTQIAFAPDDPTELWAAGCTLAYSKVAGTTLGGPPPASPASHRDEIGAAWTPVTAPADGLLGPTLNPVWHVAVGPRTSHRTVWGCGPGEVWFSTNGGQTFQRDPSPGGAPTGGCGLPEPARGAARALAADPFNPDRAFMVRFGRPIAASWFDPAVPDGAPCGNTCAAGDLWSATLTATAPTYQQLPAAPLLLGPASAYGSGSVGIATLRPAPGGAPVDDHFLLFLMDSGNVHVTSLAPGGTVVASGWRRLDGQNLAEVCPTGSCSSPDTWPGSGKMHVDPHAFAVTPGFDLTLSAPSAPPPYDQNRALAGCAGSAPFFLGNDGGLYRTENCGRDWIRAQKLPTLQALQLAAVTGGLAAPGLYFGGPDNSSWASRDGGATWQLADACGDCSGFYADPASRHFLAHLNRSPPAPSFALMVWSSSSDARPDVGTAPVQVTTPQQAFTDTQLYGWEPVVPDATGADRVKPVMLLVKDRSVHRTGGGLSFPNGAAGVPLGPTVLQLDYAKGSGGTSFVRGQDCGGPCPSSGATTQPALYRSFPVDRESDFTGWDCLVPGPATATHDGACRTAGATGPARADAFFVDPYHAGVLYVLGGASVWRTTDGGATWDQSTELTRLLTENGKIPVPPSSLASRWEGLGGSGDWVRVLAAMTFVPGEPRVRFAAGEAGVFFTNDGRLPGDADRVEHWHRILDARALPCGASSVAFDRLARHAYVGCNGRGVLRLGNIPKEEEAFTLHVRNP